MTGHDDLAQRLLGGLNGDPHQRAATTLLIDAAHGVWLAKLAGWDQYLVELDDPRRPGALCIDWQQLRDDFEADGRAWEEFYRWATSHAGRHASDDEYETRDEAMVPGRPWHGASSSELVILQIALELAPGGLLGDGLNRLDQGNTTAVLTAIDDLAFGSYGPDPAAPRR